MGWGRADRSQNATRRVAWRACQAKPEFLLDRGQARSHLSRWSISFTQKLQRIVHLRPGILQDAADAAMQKIALKTEVSIKVRA